MTVRIDLREKRALVTGGSRGLGREIAVTLAQAGAEVGISYHTQEREARIVEQELKRRSGFGWAFRADASLEKDVIDLYDKVDGEWSDGLDIFVANAGVWPPAEVPTIEMSIGQWRHTMAVNLDGVFLCTREAARRIRRGGRVVLIGSGAGRKGEPFHADYAASKGALVTLAKTLCVELAPRDVTVNCVAPGWIDTEMVAPALAGQGRARLEAEIPLGRVASCGDVAGPVVFLCSDLARHVTGEVLHVNGGATL